jgi:ATP phosphoribosyltransferase
MKVNRNNPRQYLARMGSMPDVEVVFQRAADVPLLVQNGDAALGITGFDILAEHRGYGDAVSNEDEFDEDLMVLERDLGYGGCRLVVAVPETWIDVSTCADLWHLSGYYLEHRGRGLRIATKYPVLTAQFLRRHSITHCKIFSPHGALEAAPLTDTADLIVDLTETGTTLRENHLKLLEDGTVLRSQACLVANAGQLLQDARALRVAETMLELIEARVQARNRAMLTTRLPVRREDVEQRLASLAPFIELRGIPVDEELTRDAGWYALSGIVRTGSSAAEMLEVVATLRSMGAEHIDVVPLSYRFSSEPASVRGLRERLKRVR